MMVQMHIEAQNVGRANDNNNCLVEKFMKEEFKSLPLSEKWIIMKNIRPSPVIKIKTITGETYFHKEYYEKVDWLCGCEHTSRVYCWPCILFPTDKNEWNTTGIGSIYDFHAVSKRHGLTHSHFVSAAKFRKIAAYHLAKHFVGPCSRKYRWTEDVVPANVKQITANRYVLSSLIFEILAMNEQMSLATVVMGDVSDEQLDAIQKIPFENLPELKELWRLVQDDLVDAVNRAVLEEIKNEIRTAKFVSVTVEEIVDGNCRVHFGTVLRYTDGDRIARERFVGLTDPGPDRSADVISQHVIKIAREFECEHKLVAHAYDGGSVSTAEHNDVQSMIRAVCYDSIFVNSYKHRWTAVLSQGVRHIAECEEFFGNLKQFSMFFERSSKRREAFREEIKDSPMADNVVVWGQAENVLNAVSQNRHQITTVLAQLKDDGTAAEIDKFMKHLNDFDFNFMVHLFTPIFRSAEHLYDTVYDMAFDPRLSAEEFRLYWEYLECMKDDFGIFWSDLKDKHPDGNDKGHDYDSYEKLYETVIDACIVIVKDRSHYTDDLLFLRLLNIEKFPGYRFVLPEILMKSLEAAYGEHFQIGELKTQLAAMYASPAFELNCVHCIKEQIQKSGLTTQWDQLVNLVDLIFCIPIVNPPVDRNFGIINRVKVYAWNNVNGKNMSSFAVAMIEMELVSNLLTNNSFYDNIFNEFRKKKTRSILNH